MVILGLGCNVGDRLYNLREALRRIHLIPGVIVKQVSPLYESDALLLEGAPEIWNQQFLNLAVSITLPLNSNPEDLLTQVKLIEEQMGRIKSPRWSPRIIDIDILAWNDEHYVSEKLQIPHIGLLLRPFALFPLADIAPHWRYCKRDTPESSKTAKELAKVFGSRFDGGAPLHTKQIAHRVDTPLMVGVLNLTPDSFSDGGDFVEVHKAAEQARELFKSGADIIDVGAESMRPVGAKRISWNTEWERLKPLLDLWSELWDGKTFRPKLSIDTGKFEVAEKLLSYPIDFLNDVSGLGDPKMQGLVKANNFKTIFMHNLGLPADPKVVLADDKDIIQQVYEWGSIRLEQLLSQGISRERLIFDVGIGFGKDAEQSLWLIKNIKEFKKLGLPLLVGHSRKSFLSKFIPRTAKERDLETTVFSQFLANQGVDYLRVHNVDYTMRTLKINAELTGHETI